MITIITIFTSIITVVIISTVVVVIIFLMMHVFGGSLLVEERTWGHGTAGERLVGPRTTTDALLRGLYANTTETGDGG